MCFVSKQTKEDILNVLDKDPAARSFWEVYFTYSGVKAIRMYRRAHWWYEHGHKFIARVISQRAKKLTGIEIHPAAKIGRRLFIDHGVGVVIGETAEIGDDVVLYQGVTLGGSGKDKGKRHPTIQDRVMISAGAKVLGPFTVGHDSKIGANSVVLKEVPPHSTVVGVPGRVVKQGDVRIADMDQIKLPDPILAEFRRLNRRIEELESKLGIPACDLGESECDISLDIARAEQGDRPDGNGGV
ncbi:MAG: serine O-acetyltransferase [Clostridia bacterium]|nr:serine O-acetyltransferase [Clostridia bacterium]